METRDRDIRGALHDALAYQFRHDLDTVRVDELGLCQGEVRVDIAVVNGLLHGYEIKSDRDTLERLPRQMQVYGRVFDTVTVIAGACHVEKVRALVPEWCGILMVEPTQEGVAFQDVRPSVVNHNVDAFSLVQLLWREEALEILVELGQAKGVLSKSRRYVWERLAKAMPLPQLQHRVREQLKVRLSSRGEIQRTSNDG